LIEGQSLALTALALEASRFIDATLLAATVVHSTFIDILAVV